MSVKISAFCIAQSAVNKALILPIRLGEALLVFALQEQSGDAHYIVHGSQVSASTHNQGLMIISSDSLS